MIIEVVKEMALRVRGLSKGKAAGERGERQKKKRRKKNETENNAHMKKTERW